MAKTLTEGMEAPDFALPSDQEKEVRLSKMRGKKVVLYFYLKDNTSG
jgi:peroxiredoxin Q/BCP